MSSFLKKTLGLLLMGMLLATPVMYGQRGKKGGGGGRGGRGGAGKRPGTRKKGGN